MTDLNETLDYDDKVYEYEVWIYVVDAEIRNCEKQFDNFKDADAYEDYLLEEFSEEIENGEVEVRHYGW